MHAVIRALYAEVRGLHQSAYLLAFFAFASQVLALLRDRIFAYQFGAGTELDIYYAAFKIPDVLFVLSASMLSVYVLIPFISERVDAGDAQGAQTLLSTVLSAFVCGYTILAIVVCIYARPLAQFLFPGFAAESIETLVLLMRVLLLQPFLLGLSGLASVVTQLGQRFVVYAVAPLLYNGGIIAGAWFFYPLYGLVGIVYGVVLGALLHFLIQLPILIQSAYCPRLHLRIDMRLLGSVLLGSLPRALTLSLNQIVLLAFLGIASVMSAGSVAVFQFAYNLQSVPLSIVGVSYSVAAFPILAHLFSKGEHSAFVSRVEITLRHLAFWIIPITGLIIVIRAQIVRVLLGAGAFDWNDTRLTAAALALFAISLFAQSVNLLVVRAFYAGGNTKTPFRAAIASTCVTLVLTLVLYTLFLASQEFRFFFERLFRLTGVPGTEIMMLPLGYAIVQMGHALYLTIVFARTFSLAWRKVLATCGRSVLAALGGSFVAYIVLNTAVAGLRVDTFAGIFLQGFLSGLAGLIVIGALLYLMRSPELCELLSAVRRWRIVSRVIGPAEVDTLAH